MLEFGQIELKPLSLSILTFLVDKPPMKAEEVAEALKLGVRQVDASVTKSLVRYGFVIRKAQLTRVMKKEFNLLEVTEKGKRFIQYLNKAE